MRSSALVAALAMALPVAGCLPGDTRPTPGSVYLTTQASSAHVEGVTTDDGWHLSFQRLLVGVGNVELEGLHCNSYGEAGYARLFDFAIETDPQKVGIAYGLGDCELQIDLRTPTDDAPLGIGIGERDVEQMRLERSDPWVDELERTSVYVLGTATRDGVEKQFDWSFRDRYRIQDCEPGPNGELGSRLDIAGEQALELTVVLHGEELFRSSDAEDAPLRFDELAAADVDGDGLVTLVELDELIAPPPQTDDADQAPAQERSVARMIYDNLVPRMARFAGGGSCKAQDHDDRR